MSRIILTEYPNGQQRFVVGWDHPAHGCFWQEFNLKPEDWDNVGEDWQEVPRYGGMLGGIPLERLREAVPEDLREFLTDHVMELLAEHAADPNSGYNKGPSTSRGSHSEGDRRRERRTDDGAQARSVDA